MNATPAPAPKKHFAFVRGLLVLALTPIMLFSGCVGAVSFVVERHQSAYMRGAPTVTATVVEKVTKPYRERVRDEDGSSRIVTGVHDTLTLQYKTIEGKEFSAQIAQESPSAFDKGDTLPITYDFLAPENIRLTTVESLGFLRQLYTIAGAVFLTALVLISFLKGNAREDAQ